MEKSKKNSVIYDIITFPEKLSSILIILLAAVLVFLDSLIIVFAVPKVDYTYLPNYEERTEYDWMNPYARVITGYFVDDENEIYSSMTVTFCYFGVDVDHKATRTIGSFTIVDDKDEIYYVGDLSRSTNTSYSTTSTPLSRLSKPLSGIKAIYGKVEYDQMMGGVKNKTDVICFKEEMIDINKKEIKEISYSNQESIEKIISTFDILTSAESGKTKITNKFEFKGNLEFKYHLDYQLFGIDKNGNVLDLIGIYNFSNNYSRYLSLDTRVPENVEFDYYIGVFKLIEGQEEKTIYIKKTAYQG